MTPDERKAAYKTAIAVLETLVKPSDSKKTEDKGNGDA